MNDMTDLIDPNTSATSPEAPITCAVPRNGRTLECFLAALFPLSDSASRTKIEGVTRVLTQTKRFSSTDYAAAKNFLDSIAEANPHFTITVDKKRELRPFRVGLLSLTLSVGGIPIKLEGEDPHNCSGSIRVSESDMAIVGFDELLTTIHDSKFFNSLTSPKWGAYNSFLHPNVQPRVAGSAGIRRASGPGGDSTQDFVGMFLISREREQYSPPRSTDEYPDNYLRHLEKEGGPVYVKERYRPLVNLMYPRLSLVPVKDVEDSVLLCTKDYPGLEIVQSGGTLRKKNLVMHGSPIMVSETLLLVDYGKHQKDPRLASLLEQLDPLSYFDERRIDNFAAWIAALERRLGARWITPPAIESMFCSNVDVSRGVLRPYRLASRNWRPEQHREAQGRLTIISALEQLREKYNALTSTHCDGVLHE